MIHSHITGEKVGGANQKKEEPKGVEQLQKGVHTEQNQQRAPKGSARSTRSRHQVCAVCDGAQPIK